MKGRTDDGLNITLKYEYGIGALPVSHSQILFSAFISNVILANASRSCDASSLLSKANLRSYCVVNLGKTLL